MFWRFKKAIQLQPQTYPPDLIFMGQIGNAFKSVLPNHLSELIYSLKLITNLLPEDTREVMTVDTHDSAHLECPVFTYVCSTSHNIPAAIVLRIAYVGNLTGKDMPASCAVLYLYRLLRHDDSVYYVLYTHISMVRARLLEVGA